MLSHAALIAWHYCGDLCKSISSRISLQKELLIAQSRCSCPCSSPGSLHRWPCMLSHALIAWQYCGERFLQSDSVQDISTEGAVLGLQFAHCNTLVLDGRRFPCQLWKLWRPHSAAETLLAGRNSNRMELWKLWRL